MGSEHFALELDNKAFEKLLANKELLKNPKQLQNALEFLNLLDGRCDIQLKCSKKLEQCDKCEKCKNCQTCSTCKPCTNCSECTTPMTTTKPPKTPKIGRPYIPSKAPTRPPVDPTPEIVYPPAVFVPSVVRFNFTTGGSWLAKVKLLRLSKQLRLIN